MLKKLARRAYYAFAQTKLGLKRNNPYAYNFLEAKDDIFNNSEIRKQYPKEISFLSKIHRLVMLPYDFVWKYDDMIVQVLRDSSSGFPYVIHGDERLFFPKDWDEKRIRAYYISLMTEQDAESPHCYFSEDFQVGDGEIFVDVGCAEAYSSLLVAKRAKKIILFECDPLWMQPLRLSFEKYRDKTILIKKYVGSVSEGDEVSLDEALKDYYDDPMLIKMDIEGNEQSALSGAKELLRHNNVRFAVCTYHKHDDAERIEKIFKDNGFNTSFSSGYMLNMYNEMVYPYFRKGVCKAWK